MLSIKINYQDTIQKADCLRQLASDIKALSNHDIAEAVNHCNIAWKGDACREYQKKLNQIGEKVKKRAEDLAKTADSVEQSARNYKRLEEMGKSIFS